MLPQEPIAVSCGHTENSSIRKPNLWQTSLLYSICVLLFLFAGSRAQQREFYSGVLITEFILIALPPVLMLIIFKYDIKSVLRLNKIDFPNVGLIVGIMICALPIVGILNGLNLLLIKTIFGKVNIAQPPTAETAWGLLLSVLVIGGSAGICEELLFRGTIQRGFESFGAVKSILVTSVLFGLMHVDFQRFLGTFLLGGIIGFIVYRTNSIYGGILAHFTNNSTAVILAYGANKLSKIANTANGGAPVTTGDIDMSMFYSLPKEHQMIVIGIWVIMALVILAVFGGLFTLFVIKLTKRTSQTCYIQPDNVDKSSKWALAGLIPGIAVITFIYFAQGLKLKGIPSPIVDSILSLLGFK